MSLKQPPTQYSLKSLRHQRTHAITTAIPKRKVVSMRYYLVALICVTITGCNRKKEAVPPQQHLLTTMTNHASLHDPLFAWYNTVQAWFARHAIPYPLNLEYSIKITPHAISRARYVIQIPKAYVQDQSWFAELFDALQLPIAARDAMDNWMHNNQWENIGLAIDKHQEITHKVYVGYGYHEKSGTTIIDSIEFNEKGESRQRTYKRISTHDCFSYITNLPKIQQKAIRPLIGWLHCAQALEKMSSHGQSICIKCKKGTRVAIIKPHLRTLAAAITCNLNDVEQLLDIAHNCTVSWIHLAPNETSWYLRSQRWFTPNSCTRTDH